MSESTARAERRALRRAMGPHVHAFTSDTTQAIRLLQQAIATQGAQIEYQRGQIAALQAQLLPLARPWYSRLVWIVTGK